MVSPLGLQGIDNALGYATGDHPLLSAQSAAALQNKTIQIDLVDLSPQPMGKDLRFTFKNSPDELSTSSPSRSGITQTKGGVWVEDFGIGVKEMSIRGTTGFKKVMVGKGKNQELKDGRQLIMDLSKMYEEYNFRRQTKNDSTGSQDFRSILMVFHIFSDDFHQVVHPTNLNIKRSKSNPLLYMYEMNFTILGPYSAFNSKYVDPVWKAMQTPDDRFKAVLNGTTDSCYEVWNAISGFTQYPAIKALSDLIVAGITPISNIQSPIVTKEQAVLVQNIDKAIPSVIDKGIAIGPSAYEFIKPTRELSTGLKTLNKLVNTAYPIENKKLVIEQEMENSGFGQTLA